MAREKWLDPSNWASLKPFGMGEEHPKGPGKVAICPVRTTAA